MASPRILAIDLGRHRVGLALSDELGITAQGLETLEIKSLDDLILRLSSLLRQYPVSQIVLGLPKRMDGSDTDLTAWVYQAREKLAERFSLPVHLYDERFTSRLAQQAIHRAGGSLKKHKKHLDRISAVLLLTDYLSRYGPQKE